MLSSPFCLGVYSIRAFIRWWAFILTPSWYSQTYGRVWSGVTVRTMHTLATCSRSSHWCTDLATCSFFYCHMQVEMGHGVWCRPLLHVTTAHLGIHTRLGAYFQGNTKGVSTRPRRERACNSASVNVLTETVSGYAIYRCRVTRTFLQITE